MEPGTSKDTATSNGGRSSADHSAHHIAEFGDVEKIVHLVDRDGSQDGSHDGKDMNDAVGPAVAKDVKRKSHGRKFRKRLIRRRHLQQYFHGDTLFRTMNLRSIAKDELFLDLIIVANIAAIGHELRETFKGWFEVEKFLLLFGAVFSSWRSLVVLWNFWGMYGDLFDKVVVYITFAALTGIGLGAHAAFTKALSYVSISSFLASAVPLFFNLWFSKKEELLRNDNNRLNHNVFNMSLQFITVLPYFAATFVRTEKAARILFWIPPLAQILLSYISYEIFTALHRNRTDTSRVAVNIELMTEKYEVLTLIVLGESLLAILFEAAKYILDPKARIGLLYLATVGATGLIYSFQTLYVNVDNKIMRGGTHAIRAHSLAGLSFSSVHLPYHISLVLFATGLGIIVRDVIIDPGTTVPAVSRMLDTAVRAAPATAESGPAFTKPLRWLFSVSWAMILICSAVMAALHRESPRDKTKRYRLAFRGAVAIALGVGMPFSGLKAGYYLLVHTLVAVAITVVEYLLVNMDHVGLLAPREVTKEAWGKTIGDYDDFETSDTSDTSDSETDDAEDERVDEEAARNVNENACTDSRADREHVEQPALTQRALTRRLTCKSRHRMQQIDMSDKRMYEGCSVVHN